MHWRKISAALLAASMLTGCSATSKEDFELGRRIARESPAARQKIMANCMGSSKSLSAADRRNLAAMMNVSETRVPTLVCRRVVAAVLSGRLSYAELQSLGRDPDQSKLIRIVQGR